MCKFPEFPEWTQNSVKFILACCIKFDYGLLVELYCTTSTSNLEHLQHFDVNGIIVHPGMTNNNNLLHPMQDFIKQQNTFTTTAATTVEVTAS